MFLSIQYRKNVMMVMNQLSATPEYIEYTLSYSNINNELTKAPLFLSLPLSLFSLLRLN